jgi:Rieske Fe-S protein
MNDAGQVPSPNGRRDFLKKIAASVISAVLGLVPLAAGLTVFLDPLRRKSSSTGAVRVTTLDALPNDGIPRKFPVLAKRVDAWNTFSQVAIGAIYVLRTPDNQLQAFNVVCPHAGCFVDFQPDKGHYHCPCHNSTFTVAGKVEDPSSPAPRGLDALQVEVRGEKEVWVKFQNFQAGTAEKIPVA